MNQQGDTQMGKIILSSSSPRRANILKKLNLDFEIIPSDYEEPHGQADFSYAYVENLAYNKALCTAKKLDEGIVIGADTIVVLDNKILGKPDDIADAKNTLHELSGKTHFVVTAVSVINSKTMKSITKTETTYVTFEKLTDEQIDFYVDNYKPLDKAGSYGIQELPKGFVKSVEGDMDNVIGLPSKLLIKMLSESDK